jgi:hypothetical protein
MMATKKRTAGTTPVYQELPTDLVNRLRDFARRDQRTLKVELIRAVELLLATYDRPGQQPAGAAPPAAETQAGPETPAAPKRSRGRKAKGK